MFPLLVILITFAIQSSTSSSLEYDKLAQLIERLDRMQTKMDAVRSREAVLEVENAQLTERLDRMQTKMDSIQSRVEVLEVENDKWSRKFSDLDKEKIISSHPKSREEWDDGNSSRSSVSKKAKFKKPYSCSGLKNEDGSWPSDGIYLLTLGTRGNGFKAASCIFPTDGSSYALQVSMGHIELKYPTVHFEAYGFGNFDPGVVPFERVAFNDGNAFDSGIFTVPVHGFYEFHFYADNLATNWTSIRMRVNGRKDGDGGKGCFSTSSNGIVKTMECAFRAGDTVNMFATRNDGSYKAVEQPSKQWGQPAPKYETEFSGWLVYVCSEDETMLRCIVPYGK